MLREDLLQMKPMNQEDQSDKGRKIRCSRRSSQIDSLKIVPPTPTGSSSSHSKAPSIHSCVLTNFRRNQDDPGYLWVLDKWGIHFCVRGSLWQGRVALRVYHLVATQG